MSHTTRPHTPQRMCLDCHEMTSTPVLTHSVERTSGPAWSAYCCPECAPEHLDQPRAMELLCAHTHHCDICSRPDSICPQGRALVRVHSACLRNLRITKSPS